MIQRNTYSDEKQTLQTLLIEVLPKVRSTELTAMAEACAKAVKAAFQELAKPEATG
jgi:hypothetical protein